MKKIYKLLLLSLADDLRQKKYKGNINPVAGHCYVVSEVLFHLFGGQKSAWRPQFIRHENEPHWFLKNIKTNKNIDLTSSQFNTKISYKKAAGKGFLTKNPSRRAIKLMSKMISLYAANSLKT